jgi:O-antigen/teichoic acid export membrane protein
MQDDPERLAAAWLRANRVVGAITVPSLVGLAILAPNFVNVVLGTKWSSVIPVLQILCWVGLLQSLQALNGSVLRARNRPSVYFHYSVVVTIASLAAFVVGLPWGIVGVATSYALSSSVVEPYYTWLTCRVAGISFWSFLGSLGGVAQATLAMTLALVLGKMLLTSTESAITLLALIGLGAAVFLTSLAWRAPQLRTDLRTLWRHRFAPETAA